MPCVYEFWPSADMSVPETQLDQGFANRALPVMYLSTANSGLIVDWEFHNRAKLFSVEPFCKEHLTKSDFLESGTS
jgi:hypothetical protein